MHVGHAIFVLVLTVPYQYYMTVCIYLCLIRKDTKELHFVCSMIERKIIKKLLLKR